MKKLTILVLLLMLIGIATADVYTIGTGTLSQDYIPFYGLYDYSWSKVIYTAAELSTAGLTAGQINGIGFDVGYTPSNYVSVDQRVFMRHTTATAEDNTYPDNTAFQSVYNNDYTWNGSGWHYIMFSTPFTWNGTDNIEILWENWDGDYASGPTFKYTSTSPNYLAAYKYADSTFPAVSGTTTYSRPNIQILTPDVIPPSPATLIAPADGSTLTTWNVNLSWSPSDGAIPTGYTLFYGTTNPPTIEEDLGLVTSFQINNPPFSTEYFWQVVPYNANGSATDCPIWSFTTMPDPTIGTFPWVVDFGTSSSDTFPPMDWTRLSGLYPVDTPISTTSGWIRDEWLNGPTGNNAARVNIYGTGAKYWLATPPIAIPASGYELKFDIALTYYASTVPPTAGEQADDKFIVLVDDNPGMTSPTILREWNNSGSEYTFDGISNTGENHTIDLDDYTGTVYFAFYGESTVSGGDNDFFVDNVTVRETPAGPIFAYSPDAINFGTVMNGPQTGPQNVTITNNGGGTLNISATDISISGTNAAQFSFDAVNLPAALGTGESVVIPVYVTGVTEGPISATLTINYGGTAYDVALSADVLAAGTVIIGDGTAHNSLPINPYFGYTYSQSIFMQSEINTPDQRIEKISYYWNGADATVNSNDWTVYMGHTSATEFTSTTDWIPLANLSQVFSGTVAAPAEAGWVEIVLDSPFVYNNTENLVIAVDENASSYDSSGMYYYTTAASTNRSLRYYSDGTDPDPTSPPTGTQVMAYPNVMLQFGDLPTTPVFSLDPNVTEWNFGELQIGVTASKEFTITNTGAGTLGITNLVVSGDYFSLATPWGRAVNLTTGQSYSFTVTYSPTVLGDHTGLITITDNLSRNVTTVNLAGTGFDPTISSFPWTEGFEVSAGTLPLNWVATEGTSGASQHWKATTSDSSHGASAPASGTSFAYLYCYWASTTYNPYSMITPPVALDATTKRLSYQYWIGSATDEEPLFVDISNDNQATWTTLYTHSNASNTGAWFQNTISLEAYASSIVYLRFRGISNYGNGMCDLGIDDVIISEIVPDDPYPVDTFTDVTATGDGFVGATIVAGDLPAVPNADNFTVSGSGIINLVGTGSVNLRFDFNPALTASQWFVYLWEGQWTAVAGPLDYCDVEVDLSSKAPGDLGWAYGSGSDPSLPVELSSFTAILDSNNHAVISWVTQSETGVSGYYILRNTEKNLEAAEQISSLITASNSSQQQSYSFTDESIYEPGTYYYWLHVMDIDGSEAFSDPISVVYEYQEPEVPVIPQVTEFKNVYPNPFNPSTNISYALSEEQDVKFSIYNSRGQLVRQFNVGQKAAGNYRLVWDGTDYNGRTVTTGVYFIRMQAGRDSFHKKAVLMK